MNQHIYWHAPLWEVLLVILTSLAFLGWLLVRALRRPDLPAALSAIHPAMNDQPLFFFDRVQGITCVNNAAEQTLDELTVLRPPIRVADFSFFLADMEAFQSQGDH